MNSFDQLLQRKCQLLGAIKNLANTCTSHLRIKTVHRIRRLQQQYFIAIVNIGVDQNLNGLISPVGKNEVVRFDAEECAQLLLNFAVLGIDSQAGFRQILAQIFEYLRRSANRVLVEIETQFVRAASDE